MALLVTPSLRRLAIILVLAGVCWPSCAFADLNNATSDIDADLLKPIAPVEEPMPVAKPTQTSDLSGAPLQESHQPPSTTSNDSGRSTALTVDNAALPPILGAKGKSVVLSGHATATTVKSEFGKVVSEMLADSLRKNPEYNEIEVERSEKHPFKKFVSTVNNILGEVVSINSSSASKDGAKIAMGEDADWDEKDALTYREQKLIDDLHPKIAGAMLQVAMGRGLSPQNDRSEQLTQRGLNELATLVNDQTSKTIDATMSRWLTESQNGPVEDVKSSDIIANRRHSRLLTEAAVCDDPVIADIRKELKGFSRPNKVKDALSNTLQTALDATAYTMPTGGIAAAVEVVKGVLVASTGGPEEDKLTHILYLLKRVESRRAALKEEIQLALYGKEVGVQTNNHLLIKCADAVVDNLVTPATVARIRAEQDHRLAERGAGFSADGSCGPHEHGPHENGPSEHGPHENGHHHGHGHHPHHPHPHPVDGFDGPPQDFAGHGHGHLMPGGPEDAD